MTACASEERFSGGDVHSQAFSFMSMHWRVIFSSFCYISGSLLAAADTGVPAESLLPGSPGVFFYSSQLEDDFDTLLIMHSVAGKY